MSTAKTFTRAEFVMRAMQIAERDELEAQYVTVRYTNGSNGVDIFAVPSRSHAGETHEVRHHIKSGQLTCECAAAQHGLPCGHVGAVALALGSWAYSSAFWKGVIAGVQTDEATPVAA